MEFEAWLREQAERTDEVGVVAAAYADGTLDLSDGATAIAMEAARQEHAETLAGGGTAT